jgi:hypothetical protein
MKDQDAMPDISLREPSITTRSKGQTTAGVSSGRTDPIRKLHFVLQGKGGVGKTVAALLLSQCIQESGEPVICVDTDPVNASLSSLSSLSPERVSIFIGKKVDTRSLDLLTEMLLTKEAHFVVDNGASSFVPVSQYLIENDVAGIMVEAGRQPVVHVVVTGGPGMLETMKGLASILQDFPVSVRVIVWLNEYFGPIVNVSGRPFEELPAYTENRERIFALVRLAALNEETAADLRDMFSRRLTFTQALAPDNMDILRVQKSRLFRVKQALWSQIERVI